MKKILRVSIVVMSIISLAVSANAVTPVSLATTSNIAVGTIFQIGFKAAGTGIRSTTAITFKTVDGSSKNGWYYNSLATVDGNGNPSDGKSDVGILCISNVHSVGHSYILKIKKNTDSLDTRIGYNVGGAYDAGAPTTTAADGTVTYPSGFKGTTGTGTSGWGEVTASDSTIYTSAANRYVPYGVLVPISFALVPTGMAAGSYSTTITYTMYAPV